MSTSFNPGTMRDDFSERTKRILADRVNSHCSNPTCGRPTRGPTSKADGVTNIGVAAHITAASPLGKRYDSLLTPAQRKSAENGIWCCQACGKFIDDDEVRYTVPLLQSWKALAERRAREKLESPFDRTLAPPLTVTDAKSTAVQDTGTDIPDLRYFCGMVPEEFKDAAELKLLNQGRGALGQPYVVIAASVNHGWDCGIGLFTAGEFGWELVANIRLESQKGWMPEVSYVPGQPGALVVTHVHRWGTGIFRRSTTWYRIARGEPLPLLSYPNNFYVHGWGMRFGRDLVARNRRIPEILADKQVLSIDFEIAYSIPNDSMPEGNEPLFKSFERLNLEWSETANMFVPYTSADNPARIEEIWTEGTKEFVSKNIEQLKQIAKTGTPRQREVIEAEFLSKHA